MEQIKNGRDRLHIDMQYGLNIYDNLIIWLYDADVAPVLNPHEAQEYYCIWFFIEYLLDVQDSNFLHIRYIIDNDIYKAGKELYGCSIRHPSELKNWDKLYILIATDRYALEIREQLEDLGLVYIQDFMYGTDII